MNLPLRSILPDGVRNTSEVSRDLAVLTEGTQMSAYESRQFVKPLKRGHSIERLHAAAEGYVEEAHRSERIDAMGTEHRLLQWNASFQI